MCLKFLIFTLSRRAYCRRRSLDSKGLLSETHGFLCLISCLSRRFSKGLTTIETSNSCGGVHCRTILFWGVGQITPFNGRGRDALHWIPVHLTLPDVLWSLPPSWLHTALAGSCCRSPLLSSHALISFTILRTLHNSPCSGYSLIHYQFYCH